MSSYTVAGSADNEDTAQCETIANEIKKFYKNIDFRIMIKHPNEWEEYIHEMIQINNYQKEETVEKQKQQNIQVMKYNQLIIKYIQVILKLIICRTYGFKKKINPIIFTLDGKLIGGIEQFKEMAEYKFGIDISSLVSAITTKINMKQVEKEVAAKKKIKKGKRTLQEKIQDSLKQKYEDSTLRPVKGIFISDINEDKLCPEVHVDFEQICPVHKEIVHEANLDIQKIAASDNFPPEVPDDEADKSISHIGSRKPQTDNSQLGITPRDGKPFQTPRDIKSRESQNTKTKSDFGAIPKESQAQFDEQQSVEPENNTQQVLPSQINVQGDEQQIQPQQSLLENGTQQNIEEAHINQEQQQVNQEQVENKEVKEKKTKNCLIENCSNANSEIQDEIIDLAPYLIKKMKNTDYYLAFHPEPLFDGQVILFEKYPNLNPDDYKEEQQAEIKQVPQISENFEILQGDAQSGEEQNLEQGQQNQSIPPEIKEEPVKTKAELLKENNKKLLLDPNAINIIDFSRTERDRKSRENGKKHKQLYEEQQKNIQERLNNQKQQQPILVQDFQKEQNNEEDNGGNVLADVGNLEEVEDLLPPPIVLDFKSRCSRNWVDIVKPLSNQDWNVICTVMQKLCCLVTFQVLPHGYKTHLRLSTGVINLFLRKFMICTHTNQSILPHLSDAVNEQQPDMIRLPFEQIIILEKNKAKRVAKHHTIPTLQFEHAIYYFKDSKISKQKIQSKYRKMINSLAKSPEDKLKMGINMILTREFMVVIPLRKPYAYFNNIPLFQHPLAYLGYVHLPNFIKKWPTTAYQIEDKTTSIQRLNLSVALED